MGDEIVQKAGAFVLSNRRMAFIMGPTEDQSALAIVRLGGHREGAETAWECSQREVLEESRMRITPIIPTMSFYCPNTIFDIEIRLEPIAEFQNVPIEPRPLIVGHQRSLQAVTPIFLASSDDEPVPSMETKALMLLTRKEVIRLCSEIITLDEFVSSGGKVLFNHHLDGNLPFKPFGHLMMLSIILERYPDVIPNSIFQ
ncbi:hypothetical protein [Paenibacillus sacheonensis]|uniref:Nudix hydrolase domain-containing protein n=1 Tax=Paenibacillus sacheonensis TaxID=742054 RepID=A0A7X4YPV6_9BACL|nr:hypothetical protein [Paenibacillus sacheonensis]MBM7566104.1 hypothetical protein [Paenibacillus sacheonensis]NBC70318.1 hypothetical protein [Paenibacillus sacheonensis]